MQKKKDKNPKNNRKNRKIFLTCKIITKTKIKFSTEP